MATFILQKILLDETGLAYICQTYDRFSHVAMILVRIVVTFFRISFYFLFRAKWWSHWPKNRRRGCWSTWFVATAVYQTTTGEHNIYSDWLEFKFFIPGLARRCVSAFRINCGIQRSAARWKTINPRSTGWANCCTIWTTCSPIRFNPICSEAFVSVRELVQC